jgi:hypothetical protein
VRAPVIAVNAPMPRYVSAGRSREDNQCANDFRGDGVLTVELEILHGNARLSAWRQVAA